MNIIIALFAIISFGMPSTLSITESSSLTEQNFLEERRGRSLPVFLNCKLNGTTNKEIHELIKKHLDSKKLKTINIQELTGMMTKVPSDPDAWKKYSPNELIERKMEAMPTFAQELTLKMYTKTGTADSIVIDVCDAPRKRSSKVESLTVTNTANLPQEEFILSAIDSCLELKYIK